MATATPAPAPTPLAPATSSRRFRAMGTDVLLMLDRAPDSRAHEQLDTARCELDRLAGIFTRFDPESELSRLNRRRAACCSAELVEVLELALDARRRSGGRFDPTVGAAVRAAGYDRTFDEVRSDPRPASAPIVGTGGVHIDSARGFVALASGVQLDLGAIAKGWIVDRVAWLLADVGPALVDAGGDITCTPRAGDQPWPIDIAGTGLRLELPAGGVATSGVDRRRWRDPVTGGAHHHVIDPTTGASAATDVVRVTALAATCADAEVAATTLLVGGAARLDELGATMGDVPWVAVLDDSTTRTSKEFRC